MSSDPPDAGGDHPLGSVFWPEGPKMDAWLAPGGGAVKLSAWAMKRQARWLRRARQRPFGFAPGSAHPVPGRIEDAYGAGTLSSGAKAILGLRTAVHTMAVCYGDRADPGAPAAKIVSDFRKDYRDRGLEEELRKAASQWSPPEQAPDAGPGDGKAGHWRPGVAPVTIEVVVAGRHRPVSGLRLREFSAFQLRDKRVLVTVVVRHMGPQFPDIVRLTDLEPMLSALDRPDTEAIAAALAQMRRQHTEHRSSQAPGS